MPLRARLIVLIGLVLLVSLACGGALVGWRAASSVRIELRAALDVGVKTIGNGLAESARGDSETSAARHLIATFNGNRHVRATLLDALDRPISESALFVPAQPAPDWFRDLIGGERATIRIPVPRLERGGGAIVLQTDPVNEVVEVWQDSCDALLVLTGFAALSALMICIVVGRALRPLDSLSTAFDQIAKGHYHGKLPEHGPRDLISVARGFNVMTQRLSAVAAQNRRLHERLLTLQAEERADLARDLHDEIGPLLFAVTMTTATIEKLVDDHRVTDIPAQTRCIQDAVARTQRHVRTLLGRLRPLQAIGLETAIRRLAEFWHGRRSDIAFVIDVSADEDRIGDDLKEAIYRIVQEGVSNAIRHGKPTRVHITVADDDADAIRVEVADNGIGMAVEGTTARDPTRLGLIGMRERVMALAGSLSIRDGVSGTGLTLIASLPRVESLQSQNMEAPE